jgi:hypothetical protein
MARHYPPVQLVGSWGRGSGPERKSPSEHHLWVSRQPAGTGIGGA